MPGQVTYLSLANRFLRSNPKPRKRNAVKPYELLGLLQDTNGRPRSRARQLLYPKTRTAETCGSGQKPKSFCLS